VKRKMIEYPSFHDKPTFAEAVSGLFEVVAPAADRIEVVQRMTDTYFALMGEPPDPMQLSRLGTYLLRDTPEEKEQRERAILSRRQIDYRLSREFPLDPARATRSLDHKLYGRRVQVPASERMTA
jgi:hypothetical protein